jgi:hypothetical protein
MTAQCRRLVQPVVEFVRGERDAFVEPLPHGREAGGGDGIAGTLPAKLQQAVRSGMLEHEVRRLSVYRWLLT